MVFNKFIHIFCLFLYVSTSSLANSFEFPSKKLVVQSNSKEFSCDFKFSPFICTIDEGKKILFFPSIYNKKGSFEFIALDENNNPQSNNNFKIKDQFNNDISNLNLEHISSFDSIHVQSQFENFAKNDTVGKEINLFFKTQAEKLEKNNQKRVFKLKKNDHETLSCKSFDSISTAKCSSIECTSDQSNSRYLVSIDFSQSNNPSFTPRRIEKNIKNKDILRDAESHEKFDLYYNDQHISSLKQHSDQYKEDILMSSKELEKNQDIFTLTSTGFYSIMLSLNKQCSPKVNRLFEDSKEHYENILANADLKLVLGSMKDLFFQPSVLIDDNYCQLNGVYLSKTELKTSLDLIHNFQSKVKPQDAISYEQAIEVFNQYKNDDSFYWKYKEDGCYARAEMIGQDLAKKNIYSDKIWIQGTIDNGDPQARIDWNYHVASVVYIKDHSTGKLKEYVLDPALFGAPVPKEDWLNKTNQNKNKELIHSILPGSTNAQKVSRNIYSITNRFLYAFNTKESTENVQENTLQTAKGTIEMFKKHDQNLENIDP